MDGEETCSWQKFPCKRGDALWGVRWDRSSLKRNYLNSKAWIWILIHCGDCTSNVGLDFRISVKLLSDGMCITLSLSVTDKLDWKLDMLSRLDNYSTPPPRHLGTSMAAEWNGT